MIADGKLNISIPVASGRVSIGNSAEAGVVTRVREPLPPYEGAITVTPSFNTQVLHTEHKTLLTDITVNPIPSNYGLITWNGSVLTVS